MSRLYVLLVGEQENIGLVDMILNQIPLWMKGVTSALERDHFMLACFRGSERIVMRS
jgi:hypothetical protein